jgi:uncharacterized protein YecE (DUF72 family)
MAFANREWTVSRSSRFMVGTAGWSIPREHASLFGDGDSMLARYATRFDLVEVNSSFYRPHQCKTWERWAASVPARFRFTAKLPKEITHERALRRCAPSLDKFLGEVAGLRDKLACLVVQLPPSLALDRRSASAFFALFRKRFDGALACEPRHASWFTATADTLLEQFTIARVASDPALSPAAAVPGPAGQVRYWRWHGAPRMYYSDYGDGALTALATDVRRPAPAGTTRLVVFDNTAHGHAVANAARLQDLLARKHGAS